MYVLSTKFCCEPKTAQKNKVYFKNSDYISSYLIFSFIQINYCLFI